MVTNTLVDRDVTGGRFLIEELDRQGVPVKAALWLFEPSEDRWRLLISTSLWDDNGPRAYEAIDQALQKIPEEYRPSLLDISAVGTTDVTIQALGRALKTDQKPIPVRFSRNQIDNVYIDDAWVYRST